MVPGFVDDTETATTLNESHHQIVSNFESKQQTHEDALEDLLAKSLNMYDGFSYYDTDDYNDNDKTASNNTQPSDNISQPLYNSSQP